MNLYIKGEVTIEKDFYPITIEVEIKQASQTKSELSTEN